MNYNLVLNNNVCIVVVRTLTVSDGTMSSLALLVSAVHQQLMLAATAWYPPDYISGGAM